MHSKSTSFAIVVDFGIMNWKKNKTVSKYSAVSTHTKLNKKKK